jgi:hypothetical protein
VAYLLQSIVQISKQIGLSIFEAFRFCTSLLRHKPSAGF